MNFERYTKAEINSACSFTKLCNKNYEIITDSLVADRMKLCDKVSFIQWQDKLRKTLRSFLQIDTLLEKVDKNIILVEGPRNRNQDFKKFILKHFYIKSWLDTLIPVYVCIPKSHTPENGYPAVVCLHGHGMRKENLVGLKKNWIYPGTWAKDLAEMGIFTITADQWGFGERGSLIPMKHNNYDHLERKYGLNMLLFGQTINGLRVYDTIQQINYLLSREDVNPSKIGVAGLSMGATLASYTAALDTRVDLALVAGFLSTFKASILDKSHCSDNYIPNILQHAELSDILSLIAPRKAFYINGVRDPIFPIESAIQSYRKIQIAYNIHSKKENLGIDVTHKGHKWRGTRAYGFLQAHWNIPM